MKAVVHDRYGSPDVLRLEEVEKPIPTDAQVRIQVHAASVNLSDWEGLTGSPLYARIGGLFKPRDRILGSDVAGRVDVAGRDVKLFRPGDEVFGLLPSYSGGFAEYVCASERDLALKPAHLTFEEAATYPQAAVIALQGIRDHGRVQAGQSVLINGAGGGAGSFAIQLAKSYGAEVTGVDNAGKLDFLRSLDADHVVDYTREDFTKRGRTYDFILDVVAHRSAFAYRRALKPGGTCFIVGGAMATMFQVLLLGSRIGRGEGKRIGLLMVRPNIQDLIFMTGLAQSRKVVPVIDRTFPLSEVPEALRYLAEGRAKGKIVITLDANGFSSRR